MAKALGAAEGFEVPVIAEGLQIPDQEFALSQVPEQEVAQVIEDIEALRAFLKRNLQDHLNKSSGALFQRIDAILASINQGSDFGVSLCALFQAAKEELFNSGSLELNMGDENNLNVEIQAEESVKRALYLSKRVVALLQKALEIKAETGKSLEDLRAKIAEESEVVHGRYVTSAEYRAVERARANLEKLRPKVSVKERSLATVQLALDDFLQTDFSDVDFKGAASKIERAAARLISVLQSYAADVPALQSTMSMVDLDGFLKFSLGLKYRCKAKPTSLPDDASSDPAPASVGEARRARSMSAYGYTGIGLAAGAALYLLAALVAGRGEKEDLSGFEVTVKSAGLPDESGGLAQVDQGKYDSAVHFFMSEYGVNENEALDLIFSNVRAGMVEKTSQMRNVQVGQEFRFYLPLDEFAVARFELSGSKTLLITPTMAHVKVLSADFGVAIVDISNGPGGREEKTYGNITHKLQLEVRIPGLNGRTISTQLDMEVPTSLVYLQSVIRKDADVLEGGQ
ncbi:hypothetical protein HY605_05865 [Candidatus Peregrinibacteria bacterium]|nr:hypothetical protein [Candidatus Peregrinibacteria bacterium]